MGKQYENLEKEILPFKKYIFKYWDKNGPGHYKTLINLFSIRPAARLVLHHWLIEWFGGKEEIVKKLKSLEKKNFVGQEGSYNFNFYLKNGRLYYNKEEYPEVYFDAVVDGMGDVTANTVDGVSYDHISQAINDVDIGWEIDEEIRDIISKIVKDKIRGMDIWIDTMDVKNNYPSNLR